MEGSYHLRGGSVLLQTLGALSMGVWWLPRHASLCAPWRKGSCTHPSTLRLCCYHSTRAVKQSSVVG